MIAFGIVEKLNEYLLQNYKEPVFVELSLESVLSEKTCCADAAVPEKQEEKADSLEEILANMDIGFGEMLIKKIDSMGLTDAELYKKANLNRSHFNKIKNDPTYRVQKETVLALALALELNKEDAEVFLSKAGYAFSDSSKTDLIVKFCIENRIYKMVEVNQLLYMYDQKLLGAGIRD